MERETLLNSTESKKGKNKTCDAEDGNYYHNHTKKLKIVTTIFLVIGSASMGLYTEIIGPTIPDLKDRLDVTYEEVSLALDAKSIGYCLSAVVGGICVHRYDLHLEVIVLLSFLFGTIGSVIIPWSSDLWLLATGLHLQGWGRGLFNISSITMVILLWSDSATTSIHLLYFGFGFGAFLAPQLARRFLTEQNTEKKNQIEEFKTPSILNQYEYVSNYTMSQSTCSQNNLAVPYSICAAISFLFMLVFLILYIFNCTHRQQFQSKILTEIKLDEAKSSTFANLKQFVYSFTGGKPIYGCIFFVFFSLYCLHYAGIERVYARFIFSYAVNSKHQLTSDDATLLNSVFWIAFTTGRGFSSIVSYWCSASVLIVVLLCLNIICGTVLVIWGPTLVSVLWIFTATFGIVLSPLFPAGIAWSNMYVEVKGLAVTVVIIAASIGSFIYQLLAGYLFEQFGPESLMYITFSFTLVISATFLCMMIVANLIGLRSNRST